MEAATAIGLQPAPERHPGTGGPLLEDGETVLQQFEGLQLVIGASTDQGPGTLFITEGRIVWLSSADTALGYSCEFPAISMHAVATDEESGSRPCLYIQLDAGDEEGLGGYAGGGGSGSEEEADEEEDCPLPELRLVPADAAQLEPLFQAFCEGAERNPDHSEDEEGEGGLFYDQDEVLAGAAAAALGVGDVQELVGEDPGRFEDAEGEAAQGGGARQPNGGC